MKFSIFIDQAANRLRGAKLFSLAFLFVLTTFSSCKKFLEEPVDNRTLITTVPDMEKTLNTLLPYSDHHFTDIMSDDYIFRDLSGHIVESAAESVLPIFEFAINRQSISIDKFLCSQHRRRKNRPLKSPQCSMLSLKD